MASVELANVALPALKELVPSCVFPSINFTEPVAADGATVAVKVTADPYEDGFAEDVSVTEEACFTVCVSTDDVLPL
jgi:hypothetical protein